MPDFQGQFSFNILPPAIWREVFCFHEGFSGYFSQFRFILEKNAKGQPVAHRYNRAAEFSGWAHCFSRQNMVYFLSLCFSVRKGETKTMEITINGLRVQYIDRGPRDSDVTVLLLHGWGVDGSLYHLITDHLSSRCRIIVPDLPGFGGSQEPSEPWNVDAYTAFVTDFIQALRLDRLTVMGHSNGGRILIKLLSREGLPFTVEKAVLLDSAGVKPRRGFSYYMRVYTYKTAKWFFRLPGIRSLFPRAVENAQKKFGSADYKQASPVMRQSMVMAVNEDLTPLLPHIRVPTLLIWGEDDTATPLSDGKTMEKLIPDAGLVALKGGHYAFADSWGQCSRVLDAFIV